jgi:thiol:disulfide interchange protein DsbD
MIVAALYFLRNVSHPLGAYGKHTSGWLGTNIIAVLAGVALGGIHLSFKYSPAIEKLRKGIGVTAIVVGAFGIVGWILAPKESVHLAWIQGEQAGVDAARAKHSPALLDFYADWCLPCKEMELHTFHAADVAAELASRFTLVKVDTTNDDDPKVAEAKQRWGADTLPTVVLLDSEGKLAKRINHVVEPGELLALLKGIK